MPKMTHENAHYHDASSKARCCAKCNMYRTPPSCVLVAKPIRPEGVCRYFQASGKK